MFTGTKGKELSQGGTALVLTLWLLALISALAMSFALSARTGSAITRNFKEGVILRSMAVQAIENTVAYLLTDPKPEVDYVDGDGNFRTDNERPPVTGIINSGRGTVYLTLSAEDARININYAPESVLRKLFDSAGAKDDDRAAMVSSLMDWRDPDDLYRLNGAEDSHYIPLGYRTSGMPLEVTEELLLVKGFSMDMLKDNAEGKGLSDMITTFSDPIKKVNSEVMMVNFNAVNLEVMIALGIDQVRAESIISARESSEGLNLGTLKANIPTTLKHFFAIPFSKVFRIETQAALEGSPQVYHITSIVKRIPAQGGQEIKTIYWKENIEAGGA